MKRLLPLVLVALLAVPAASAQSPHELFQQALRLERSQGDLAGAIALYEQIVGSPETDRPTVAKVLVQMGKAYESLGRTEAFSVYERVVRDFSDLEEPVAEARTRMRGLTASAPVSSAAPMTMVAQTLMLGLSDATVSNDGRYFANIDWNDGRLAFQEIGGEEITYMTSDDYESSSYALPNIGRFSPDNRYFAYSMEYDSTGTNILVFDMEEGSTRTVRIQVPETDTYVEVYDWTSDGSAVLIALSSFPDRENLALVDIVSGEVKFHHRTEQEFAWVACLLDDRFVLFENRTPAGTDLRRLDLVTGSEEDFLPHASGKGLGGCSNQKQAVAVMTDLFGDPGVWVYPVVEGRPSGDPINVGEAGANDRVIKLSDQGALFLSVDDWRSSTMLLPYSAESGTIMGRGEALPTMHEIIFGGGPRVVRQRKPAWTADGSKLAYRIGLVTLWIRERSGESRTVRLETFPHSLTWSGDGTALLAAQHNRELDRTLWVDAVSGSLVDSTQGPYGFPGFSGDTVLEVRRRDADTICVFEYTSGSSESEELACYEDSRSVGYRTWPSGGRSARAPILVLPNTRQLVVSSYEGDNVLQTLVDVDNGTARVFLEGPEWWERAELLPDGTGILALTKEGEFFRVPFDGGAPEAQFKSFTEINFVQYFALHPTENQILITSTPRTEPKDSDEIAVVRGLWDRMAGQR